MSLEPQDIQSDYRLADYKPLLPLGPGVRALIGQIEDHPSLTHLIDDLGEAHDLHQANGQYDLAIGSDPALGNWLKPGGLLCLLGDQPVPGGELLPLGRWHALPGWPSFRSLVPANPAGHKAALGALRLLPQRTPSAALGRVAPGLAALLLPAAGVALYTRGKAQGAGGESLLARADRALGGSRPFRPDQWLIVSGRLGPGNPILAFQCNGKGKGKGQPRQLVKLARDRGADHLAHEAGQIAAIIKALGPALSERVIAPIASATIDGRHALAYEFVSTQPFRGLRWRFQGRAGLCHALTDWLIQVATRTRQAAGHEIESACHLQPLQQLIDRNILPGTLQQEAGQSLNWLQRRSTLPTVFEHGDLGIYNLRLLTSNGRNFKVLDWGSSTFTGIAAGDLLYLLGSARAPARLATACLQRYLHALDLPASSASALWWAYLARRWAELDTIRPPHPDQPESGGGLLLAVHAQARAALAGLARD